MKTLLILRHGKAEPRNIDERDFDRKLAISGRLQAEMTGNTIAVREGTPDLIYSSSAPRAWETARIVAEKVSYSLENIRTDGELYMATSLWLRHLLGNIGDEIISCILVGHNPGLTDLINHFGVRLDHLPTASVAAFQFNVDSWKEIAAENAHFLWLYVPEK
ncbi:SixA phosphatase family protein [Seramator thermalis]|jgi:phosphohistidine phosphatase|uniref:SixA phosphatase family protein n=1 Tax=Seramator thermalis TaxID=2496270 RepID=UPI00101B5E47|nr:histidine phosphatase family protein [Seramator thermalis]